MISAPTWREVLEAELASQGNPSSCLMKTPTCCRARPLIAAARWSSYMAILTASDVRSARNQATGTKQVLKHVFAGARRRPVRTAPRSPIVVEHKANEVLLSERVRVHLPSLAVTDADC